MTASDTRYHILLREDRDLPIPEIGAALAQLLQQPFAHLRIDRRRFTHPHHCGSTTLQGFLSFCHTLVTKVTPRLLAPRTRNFLLLQGTVPTFPELASFTAYTRWLYYRTL